MTAMGWRAMNNGVSSTYLALALLVLVLAVQTTGQSHTETYATYRIVARQVCRQNSREVCDGWWTGRECNTEYYCDYDTVSAVESVTSTRCQKGWSPYPDCNEINECTEGVARCDQICINTVGSYTCSCNAGYRLASDGRTCNVISNCPTATCQQTCNETNGSNICGCYAGYKLSTDGRSCNDIDECEAGISGCSDICNNTIGSYTCGCNSGHILAYDRHSCQDVDECLMTSTCSQVCNNTIGCYVCDCNSGYALASDKRSCQDIDECTAHLDNCTILENFGCENTIGGYQCICKTGFEQVGPSECRDINECETLSDNCTLYENMTCENIIGSYKCARVEFQGQFGGSLMLESTVRFVIVVTVCVVVGVALIIIAVVCFVMCAKKRKMKKADPKANGAELPADNVYDDVAMTTNVTCIESDNGIPVDSRETAIEQSTSTNKFKSVKRLFKSQKEKTDPNIGKATSDSIYEDLVEATDLEIVYEAINMQLSNSIDISVQGEVENSSSHA